VNTSNKAAAAVLIVDDQDNVRAVTATMLRARGIASWAAADGDAAVQLLNEHLDEIAVALVDLKMPGLDGLGTIKALHGIKPNLPCVITTGTATMDAVDLLASGAVASISKPFPLDELYRIISRWAEPGGEPTVGSRVASTPPAQQ
jgi:DNA-binding NtrC family response regulator